MANKVHYGLSNVHYALITVGEGGAVTYGAFAPIPGAVNLTISPVGGENPFYADNIKYFIVYSNQGYEGTLEIAKVPQSFFETIMQYKLDDNGVLVEANNAQPKSFALAFQVEGDEKDTRFVFYNVSVGRSEISAATITDSVDVQTATLSITAAPATDTGYVSGKTTPDTSAANYDAWFTTVQTPTFEEGGEG